MLRKETQKDIRNFFLSGTVLIILIFALFSGFQLFSSPKAQGGGFVQPSSKSITVNATSTTQTPSVLSEIKGNFLVAVITTYAPKISVSSISDTQSDTWHNVVKSAKFEDTEIWYANFTGTNFGANTITYTFNASTSASIQFYWLTGIVNTSSSSFQTVKNNGTATSASVASFTPKTNYACINGIGADTGSTTSTTWGNPNFWYLPSSQNLGATVFHFDTQLDNNWASYGATTVSTSMSPTSSPQWDDVVACFQTESPVTTTTTTTTTNGMSAGILQVKNSTTVNAVTNTATMDYNPQKYNLLIDIVFEEQSFNTKVPTDNNGLIWKSIVNVSTAGNFRISYYGVNFSIASTSETIRQNLTSSAIFMFRVYEITGISSNWQTVFTEQHNNGVTLVASLPSFTPPTNWLGLENLLYNFSDTSTHTFTTTPFVEFNGANEEESMQNKMGSTEYWDLSAFYTQWNLGSTTATITPNAATNPIWLESVLFLPTQTSGIVTNTLTSTTTTTTTNTSKTTTTSLTTSTTTSTNTTTLGFGIEVVQNQTLLANQPVFLGFLAVASLFTVAMLYSAGAFGNMAMPEGDDDKALAETVRDLSRFWSLIRFIIFDAFATIFWIGAGIIANNAQYSFGIVIGDALYLIGIIHIAIFIVYILLFNVAFLKNRLKDFKPRAPY